MGKFSVRKEEFGKSWSENSSERALFNPHGEVVKFFALLPEIFGIWWSKRSAGSSVLGHSYSCSSFGVFLGGYGKLFGNAQA